jgi:2-deoxy-D-gluconate 3-dehydrogenase
LNGDSAQRAWEQPAPRVFSSTDLASLASSTGCVLRYTDRPHKTDKEEVSNVAKKTIAQLFDLSGQGAIVTGGGMGIGRAIAMRLAEAGAAVMVTDIDLDAAAKVAQRIKEKGGKGEAIKADAGSPADAAKVAQSTVQAFGTLDILVNNAGIYPMSKALETTEQLWDKTMGINLKGAFFYAQAAAREMVKANHGGKIINMASIDAVHPTGEVAHYNASKGGVMTLTKALALEWAPNGITVNAVAPGNIWTPGTEKTRLAKEAKGETIEELYKKVMARLPMGRAGEPDDIAKVVLFYASEAASYITGTMLIVDGGYLLS